MTQTQTQDRPAQGLFDDRPPAFLVREEEEMPAPVTASLSTSQVPRDAEASSIASMMQIFQGSNQRRDANALKKEAVRIGREMQKDGYYAWKQGSSRIEGITVWMMEALAAVWGKYYSSIIIERVEGNRITLRGRFIDLLTGVIIERPHMFTLAPPPGKFAKDPAEVDRWNSLQLNSAASKAARNVLNHGLPAWFTEPALRAAMDAAREDLLKGRSLEQAVRETLAYFAEMKITQAELEAQQDVPITLWVDLNILDLRDLARALKQGQTTIEAVFGPVREKLAGAAPASVAAPVKAPRGSALGVASPAAKDDVK